MINAPPEATVFVRILRLFIACAVIESAWA